MLAKLKKIMDFKLTPEQLELQKVAQEYAQNELPALADELEETGDPVPKAVSYTHLTLPTTPYV